MDRKYERQPRGVPIGGQFAARAAAPASPAVVLDDPWAGLDLDLDTPAPAVVEPTTQPEPEATPSLPAPEHPPAIGMGLDAERALMADLHIALAPAPSDAAGHRAYLDARGRILEQYGSNEQAVITLGHSVAARAEHAAGTTGEQVRADWVARCEQSKEELEHLEQRVDLEELGPWSASAQELRELTQRHLQLRSGRDAQAKRDLRRLADGYHAALSELREMGGQMQWHAKTQGRARTLFDQAAQMYPSDWIASSNGCTTNRGGRSVGKPYARLIKDGGDYTDAKPIIANKTVVSQWLVTPAQRAMEALGRYGRSTDPFREYRPLTEEEAARSPGSTASHMVTAYAVTRGEDSGTKSPPPGRGWEHWTDPSNPDHQRWRRPSTRTQKQIVDVAPVITANPRYHGVEGRPSGFSVAVHELAHRFENTVPGMKQLENDFLTRRTTDGHGNRDKPARLYDGARTYADHFPAKYMGKIYPDGSREILSTGTQALFGGDYGGLVGVGGYSADSDYRAFVLGAMASLPRGDGGAF